MDITEGMDEEISLKFGGGNASLACSGLSWRHQTGIWKVLTRLIVIMSLNGCNMV